MTSSATINSLSLECLALVLDNLKTVQDLSIQRKVSPPFRAVAEKLLLSFRTLKYFPNAGRLFDYLDVLLEHNLLDESSYRLSGGDFFVDDLNDKQTLDQAFPLWLPKIMSNVTDLVIVLKRGANYDLDAFLGPWASQLECLTLVGNSAGYEPLSCETLSKMGNLRRLNLFNFDLASLDTTRLASVLSGLSHLGLYGYYEPVGAVPSLRPPLPDRVTPFLVHLTPGRCTSLSLSRLTWHTRHLARLTKSHPQLLATLRELHLNCQEDGTLQYKGMSYTSVDLIVGACAELTSLQAGRYETQMETLPYLFRHLSPLTRLTSLRLFFQQSLHLSGNLSRLPSLPGLRHLQLHLNSSQVNAQEPFSTLKYFLVNTCPALDTLTLFSRHQSADWASGFGSVRLQQYSIDSIESSPFLPERFHQAILAYQEGAIERELAQLGRRPSYGPSQALHAIPLDSFFRLASHSRLDEHSGTLAQRAIRRQIAASACNRYSIINIPSYDKLAEEFNCALCVSLETERESLLLDRFSPQALRRVFQVGGTLAALLKLDLYPERSSRGSSGCTALGDLARREAVAPSLGPLLSYLNFHSPKCSKQMQPHHTFKEQLACFYAHYTINWRSLERRLSIELSELQEDMVDCFGKFSPGNRGNLRELSHGGNLLHGEVPSMEDLAGQSWRSYLATGRATNWLSRLMSRIRRQLEAQRRKEGAKASGGTKSYASLYRRYTGDTR